MADMAVQANRTHAVVKAPPYAAKQFHYIYPYIARQIKTWPAVSIGSMHVWSAVSMASSFHDIGKDMASTQYNPQATDKLHTGRRVQKAWMWFHSSISCPT
jgi:hypothetical protein